MSEGYDVQAVEAKWQQVWDERGTYAIDESDPRPKFYDLCMYPYPSGPIHMGHVRNYTLGDVLCRYKTMQGFGVLSPMGWDSFGLPAENAAIAEGIHPGIITRQRIATMKTQIKRLGSAYDWRREVSCCEPDYYRWTQWLFVQLHKAGLAYKQMAPVNWCPSCQTVLANEQAEGGTCDRCGTEVVKRDLEQWMFRITDYAQQLIDDLDTVDWPERVKVMQRNWIGRSEGVEFDIAVKGSGTKIRVFTTRIDTVFGMTYVVLAPEHPLVPELTAGTGHEREVAEFVSRVRNTSEVERQLHRRLRDQPVQRRRGAAVPGRLRPRQLRNRRHHGRSRRGPARLRFRPRLRAAGHQDDRAARGVDGADLRRARQEDQQRVL
jgi:leucyl-tRNA synthetase